MRARSLVSFVAAACAAIGACGVGSAQVLYSENFEDGNAASRWTVSQTGGTNLSDFAYDYSTVSIPSAPNGTGSTGLRYDVNIGPTGAPSAIIAFPNGQSFTPSYTLAFDLWLNVGGEYATSTEFGIFGGGHTSTSIQAPTSANPGVGPSASGIDFALTGDEGAGRDVRAYVDGIERTGSAGTPTAGGYARSTTATQPQDAYMGPYFFGYTGTAPENQRLQMAVTITATQSTWMVNGNTWARTTATTGVGNIMLGYMDLFASIAPSDVFAVYDNVRVTAPLVAPTEQLWAGNGLTAGGAGTWTNMGRSWLVTSGSAPWNWALPTVFEGPGDTVTIDGAVTAGGGLDFRTNGYTITSGSLFLGATTPTDVRRDSQIFDPNASTQVNVASGVTATIASEVRGRMGLTKTGPGKLVLAGPNPVSGATTVQAGTIRLGNQYSLLNSPVSVGSGGSLELDPSLGTGIITPQLTVNGGTVSAPGVTLTVDRDFGIRNLVINSGLISGNPGLDVGVSGTVVMSGSAINAVDVSTLTVQETGTDGGRIDLGIGRINVAAGGITAEALVADIVAGRGDGSWTGATGITSSKAASEVAASNLRAVGWIDDGAGALSVAYAAPGDTNIDWVVDILDVSNLVAAGKFGTSDPATWAEGDFNYDGIVDIQDIADFSATGLYGGPSYNAPAGSAVAAVPEPATAACAGLGLVAAALFARRRAARRGLDGNAP